MLDTLNSPVSVSKEALSTAKMVENGISNYILKTGNYTKSPQIEHKYTIQSLPKIANKVFKDYDTTSDNGAVWMFLPISIAFMLLSSELMREKERKLRIGLSLFGVDSFAYYLSWILFSVIFSAGYSGLLNAIGWICELELYLNTPFYVIFLYYWVLSLSYNAIAFLTVSRPK